jgi:hypothetical protein
VHDIGPGNSTQPGQAFVLLVLPLGLSTPMDKKGRNEMVSDELRRHFDGE